MLNRNPTLFRNVSNLLNSKGTDQMSIEVDPIPKLVLDIIPPQTWSVTNAVTTTGNLTAALPSILGRYFLTNASVSIVKNVTCDQSSGSLQFTFQDPAGVTTRALTRIAVMTLTAERIDMPLTFYPAVEVAAGTSLTLTGSFTAGAMVRSIHASGYFMETTKSSV